MIDILANPNATHQVEAANALQSGFKIHGIESNIIQFASKSPHKNIACWSWHNGKRLYDDGKTVLVMERSYIGDRFHYISLGFNGLNGHAIFPKYKDDGGKRFREIGGKIKTWKKTGQYILILGQVQNDASLQGKDISKWYRDIAKQASEAHGLPVYFRPHPEAARRRGYLSVNGMENIGGDLQSCLDGALFTIAFNSNSCLDSIMSGIPCYAGDKGTMAYDLCMKDIRNIIYPEREDVLHRIAWTQWTPQEIASGLPIKGLLECGLL